MGWDRPDIVVSGINHGANVGTTLLYSGTVAAAFEARFESAVPAIAISQEIPEGIDVETVDFTNAVDVAKNLVELVLTRGGMPPNTIWNVNIPYKTNRGEHIPCAVTKPATLIPCGAAVTTRNIRNQEKIEFTIPLRQYDKKNHPFGTDVRALDHGVASITPLHLQPDLHCPSRNSLTLKNHIKYHDTLKLIMDLSWDTEFPKNREKIVKENIHFMQHLAERDLPMHVIVQQANERLFQCEHYMGSALRDLIDEFGYREVGGFPVLARREFQELCARMSDVRLMSPEQQREERHAMNFSLGIGFGCLITLAIVFIGQGLKRNYVQNN